MDKKYLVLFFIIVIGISFVVYFFVYSRKISKVSKISKLPKELSRKSIESCVSIGFAGDAMLGRMVNETLKTKSSEYIWGNIRDILLNNDFNIVNLETTLTNSEEIVPKVFNFKSDPNNIQVLKNANISVVNVANNHIKDFNIKGMLETLFTLNNAGIEYVGAGRTVGQARNPVILEKNGIKIGVLGATDNEPTWAASDNFPGVNYFSVNNLQNLLQNISELKKQVDIVIISLHWGPNMRQKPTDDFIAAAHAMVDSGADIIHGHSAHVFQGIELYKNSIIMYDTGDLVDDYAVDLELRNDLSFLFILNISKNGVCKVELTPIKISMTQVNLAPKDDAKWSLNRIKQLSQEFNTAVEINNNKAVILVDNCC